MRPDAFVNGSRLIPRVFLHSVITRTERRQNDACFAIGYEANNRRATVKASSGKPWRPNGRRRSPGWRLDLAKIGPSICRNNEQNKKYQWDPGGESYGQRIR